MTKRKKKHGKRSPQAKKSSRKSARGTGAPVFAPEASQLFTPPPSALTPALPASERGRGNTRGGKSTFSTHELLQEVPTPPRSKPAPPAPRPQSQKPPASPKPTAPRAKSTPSSRSAPHKPLSMAQIYETLAALLVPYARKMESEMHPKIGFCLKARSARTGRETHFGAVQALPDGVAYHLFPLYGHPELLEGVSPELFNCMRGKTCFHFAGLHAGLVAELAELTHRGFERFLSDGVF
jgi:hypothetical protein